MKFNFKKVASVIATTAMLGSTIAFATAALSLPASDYAVVYGASTDNVAALDMAAALTSSATTVITGDNIKLEKSTNKFNLGDSINTFYTTLDNEELTTVLATGVYENDENNEFDFEQSITPSNLTLFHFQNDDFNDEKPIIGFELINDESVLNYTLEFTPDAAECTDFGLSTTLADNCETTDLTMLGRSYYVVKTETTSYGVKLTLLDNANSAIVSQGETKTITVGDKSYSVEIDYIDSDEVMLVVDGTPTNKLVAGDVFKVATDTYVAVKNILFDGLESSTKKVEISIGTGKITLENNREVQMNGEAISTIDKYNDAIVNAYITNTTSTISKIVLEWKIGDDTFVAPGSDLVLPGFETIKIATTGFNSPKAEVTSLKASSETFLQVKTTIKDGELTLPILYNNNSIIQGVGEKSKKILVTNSSTNAITFNLNETEGSYFVVTYIDGDEAESYAYKLQSITDNDGKNSTVLENLASDGSDVSFSEVGKDKDVGNVKLTLDYAKDHDKFVRVNATKTGSGILYADRIVTAEGLMFKLPVNSEFETNTAQNAINVSALAASATWEMNVTEEDKDGNIGAKGQSFEITFGINVDDGLEPTTISTQNAVSTNMYETEDGSKEYVGYVQSDLATKILWDKPTSGLKSIDLTYAGDESSGNVYISEAGATSTTTSTIAPVLASALTDADKAKNLIVVGGSCINTVAAKLITGLETPLCSAAFAAKTGVGAGKYMIKGYDSPYATGKIAVLVAGYEADQTADAVKVVKAKSTLTKSLDEIGPTLAA